MFIEVAIDEENLLEYQDSFRDFINDGINKQLIMNTIDNKVKSNEWPGAYYTLRDDLLPLLMGEEAARFLFWIIFSDGSSESITYTDEEAPFISYLILNYSLLFRSAKLFNINPLGYNEISFTVAGSNEYMNTYIKRHDGEVFMMRNDAGELAYMLQETFMYFTSALKENVIDYDDHKEVIEELIEKIEIGTPELKRMMNMVDASDE